MSSFLLKNSNIITGTTLVTKSNSLNIEIPSSVENNIISFDTINFFRITSKSGDNINNGTANAEVIKINSFGFDDLPLYITDIKNKNTKEYTLK